MPSGSAGSMSYRRASQSLTPGERERVLQEKKAQDLLFDLPSRRLRPGTSRPTSSNGAPSLSDSLVVRTRTPLGSFVTNPSLTPTVPLISRVKKVVITHVSFSRLELLVNSSLSRTQVWSFRYSTNHLLAVRKSVDVLSARPEPPSGVRPTNSSLTTSSTQKGSKLHLVVDRKNATVCIVDKFYGFSMPIF